MSRTADDLIYVPPPAKHQTVRRVYVLPRDLVKQIHDYGYANGHQSEVSAVRELLEKALVGFALAGKEEG
ncbi:hypothetical protein [Rhodoligotrophos ferricapiens]|uniref:hypothetical protein n=1 Tax=Rhodoligotrophos ferricapiens TaxID=3069264 RepID=UPI00315C4D7F